MAEQMFDGFDHTAHRREVAERWGEQAAADSDRWWQGLDEALKGDWKAQTAALGAAWTDAATRAIAPDGAEAHELAARHVAWLRGIPGTPTADPDGDVAGYVRGLGELYVADPRFAANYGGQAGAEYANGGPARDTSVDRALDVQLDHARSLESNAGDMLDDSPLDDSAPDDSRPGGGAGASGTQSS